MNEIINIQSILLPAITGAMGVIGSTFWVTRWINKTDKKLDDIQVTINKIKTNQALVQQTQDNLTQKCKCYDARLTEAEKKVWGLYNAKPT